MTIKNITEIKKRKVADICNPLLSESDNEAMLAAEKLQKEAASYGLALNDFLDLAIDLSEGDEKAAYKNGEGLSGFEQVMFKMNLPMKNNYKDQVTLAQASDTFATKPGSRILFPYAIDNVLRWNNNIDQMEKVADILSGSRTTNGNELIRIVAEDDENARKSFRVGEGARIPMRKVRYSDRSVQFYKHGSGIEYTYEFERRAALDIITPFAARVARDLEISKMKAATDIMINGDGVNGAATALSQASIDSGATDGTISYDGLLGALATAVKAHHPIDTIAGNIDAYLQLVKLFGVSAASSAYEVDQMAGKGGPQFMGLRNIFTPVNFVLDSAVPAGKLLMFNRPDTLEELVEANSRIAEEEKNVLSQVISYVRTENTGYSLIYPDCRYVYTYKA